MTDPDTLGTAVVGLGILAASIYNGVQSVQAKRAAKASSTTAQAAHHEAQRAADNSHPISNGWGTALRADSAEMRSLLDRIDRRQIVSDERAAVLEREVREANHHAQQANQHARTAAEQSSAVATGLAAHLADHTASDLTPAK